MTAKGHMTLATTGALLAYGVIKQFEILNIKDVGISYLFILIGSVLPDIDEPDSYIGRRLGAIGLIVGTLVKHRTITHYLILPLLIALFAYYEESGYIQTALYSLSFGIILHDVGDMLTKGGITGFFFPITPNTKIVLAPKILRFYTNSVQEYLLIMVLMVLNILLFAYFAYFFIIGSFA